MSVNSALLANNPVWTQATTSTAVPALGPGAMAVPLGLANGGSARSVTISNTGPVNLWVGTLAAAAILLQPGAAITLAIGSGGEPFVHDTVGTGTWGLVAYE